MSLLIWGMAAFLWGIVVFLAGPLVIGPQLPEEYRQGLANYFMKLCAVWGDHWLLGVTRTGRPRLTPSTENVEYDGAEETSIGGETMHFQDPNGLMGYFKNKPFGLVFEGKNVIFTPREAEIAEYGDEAHETNQLETEVAVADGGSTIRTFADDVLIPDVKRAVDLRRARHAFGGSADPTLAEATDTIIEKSQQAFNKKKIVESMFWILCMGAGAGVVYIGKSQFSGGGKVGDIVGGVSLSIIPYLPGSGLL